MHAVYAAYLKHVRVTLPLLNLQRVTYYTNIHVFLCFYVFTVLVAVKCFYSGTLMVLVCWYLFPGSDWCFSLAIRRIHLYCICIYFCFKD